MITKLQVLDYIEIASGIILGICTKILGGTVAAVLNIGALLLFVIGIINIMEDKYGFKVFDFKPAHRKIDYKNTKALH